MFRGKKRERKVQELLSEHLVKIEECIETLNEAINAYLTGNLPGAKELAYKVHLAESGADKKRRAIIQQLYEGAFLPIDRDGLIKVVAVMDKIADRAESGSDFLLSQRPEIPEEFKESIRELSMQSTKCFAPLKEAMANLFKNFTLLRKKTTEVNVLEAGVDTEEWKITKAIFASTLPLARKMHLEKLVWHIAEISDVCQDAADSLESIAVKKTLGF